MAVEVKRLALPPPLRAALVPAGVFVGGVLISGFTMLRELDPFDEGLVLQAARRVAEGQMPYRDFLWSYGPGQPYLLGALFEALGTSLVHWRVVRVLADAGVALAVFVLLRREAGPWPAAVAWLAAACAMAQPRSANPFPIALLFALLALLAVTSDRSPRARVAWGGALTALAAAWRLDFGLYAGAAVAIALVLRREQRAAAACAGLAAGLTLLAHLPFLVADGPADLYDALVATSLREKDWWTLPFPLGYDGPLGSAADLDDLLEFYVPALLVAGLAVAAAAALARVRAERDLPPSWGGLLVLAAGGMAYLLSRTDEFHVTPLLVVAAALLALAAARRGALGVAAAAVLALLLVNGASNRLTAIVRPPDLETVDVEVADGVSAPPEDARALEEVVPLVRALVPAGEPMYVAPRRSDLVAFSNPLLYVLAERPNPTDRDFGLLARRDEQLRAVTALRRARPRAVVRWTAPISSRREANRRGRSSGDRTLDRYLEAEYRLLRRAGDYDVLVPRTATARP